MWHRLRDVFQKNLGELLEPETVLPLQLPLDVDYPKPELKTEDPDSVVDIKTLFRDAMFPPPKGNTATRYYNRVCLTSR